MRFFRKPDLNEQLLSLEFAEEVEFVKKAHKIRAKLDDDPLISKVIFSNLYHFSRRYEYVWFSSVISDLESRYGKARVLDVGCGASYAPFSFAGKVHKYHGIDILDYREFYKLLNKETSQKNLDFSIHDITQSSPAKESYEAVISISVLEHIPAELREAALENCVRSLCKGGILAISLDIDLEDHGNGANFDELVNFVALLEKLGMSPLSPVDLTTYENIVSSEALIGLPEGRFQLPWRRRAPARSFNQKVIEHLKIKERKVMNRDSLAVSFGAFEKIRG